MITSNLALHFKEFIINAEQTIHIIAPFVRLDALEYLLNDTQCPNVIIVTTWKTADILNGSSDIYIYTKAKERGWYIYLCPHLHAKLLVSDITKAIVTSANITKKAIGLVTPSNIECAENIESLSDSEKFWLFNLINDSMLVQDDYFNAIKEHIESQSINNEKGKLIEFDSQKFEQKKSFLLSSLPMSDSPQKFLDLVYLIRLNKGDSISEEERACTLHDMALYSIPLESNDVDFELLKINFFEHPFIRAFCSFVEDRRFFGETKAWVQQNCTNVPVPRRRDLTGHVRILFDWLVELGEGKFVVERPNYSECIYYNVKI